MEKNKAAQFVARNWHWFAFAFLCLIVTSYLLTQSGVWLFTDSGYFSGDLMQAKRTFLSKLGQFSRTDGIYLGYDNSAIAFAQIPITLYQYVLITFFGGTVGQIVFYLIYYFLCFFFGLKLFSKLFDQKNLTAIRLGALFLAFNPFSILIVTLLVVGYVYAAFIAFLYLLIRYLETGKVNCLIGMAVFGVHLLSYLRLIPIELLTLVFVMWLFPEKAFWRNYRRWAITIITAVLIAVPFIVGNLGWINNSESVVGKYTSGFSKYERANYDFKSSAINALSYSGGFTAHPLSYYYNHRGLPGFADNYADGEAFEFLKIVHLIGNAALLIVALTFARGRRPAKLVLAVVGVLLVNTIGSFVSLEAFLSVHKTVLVYLYNDYGFMQFIQSILLSLLVIEVYDALSRKRLRTARKYFVISGMVFIALSLSPFFSGHYGFEKLEKMPDAYNVIYDDKEYDAAEATMFVPFHWLNFSWSPYFLDLNTLGYSKYQTLVVPNLRYIDTDFTEFYNRMYGEFSNPHFTNVGIFNIKNIFAFRDVKDANNNIDTYLVTNIESSSHRMSEQLIKRDDIFINTQNGHFAHYRLNESDRYDYFIYAPKTLYDLTLETFYDDAIDLTKRPVLFDQKKLGRANYLNEQALTSHDVELTIKASPDNANKYYVKIENINQPFLLVLNQMYSDHWKLYFTDEDEWNRVVCDNAISYEISKNNVCRYRGSAFDLSDLRYWTYPRLNDENHFMANITTNAFMIDSRQLPLEYRGETTLYAILYFEKQLNYLVSLVATGLVFMVLVILFIRNTIITLIRKRYEN